MKISREQLALRILGWAMVAIASVVAILVASLPNISAARMFVDLWPMWAFVIINGVVGVWFIESSEK